MALSPVEKLRTFLSQQSCLIVESSNSQAMSLRAKLVELGVQNTQIWTANKIEVAKELLTANRPTLFILEYEMDAAQTNSLIQLHEKMYVSSQRTVFIMGRSVSIGVVLEDRQGQIDSFLLKPFSADNFRERLILVAKNKVEPELYLAKLNSGITHLANGENENAMRSFDEAATLNPKPTMAWYYKGETARKLGHPARALEFYREGLKTMPLHYRCALAEFETLKELGKPEDAFNLVEEILAHFPVSRTRLGHFFDLAVTVKRFDELPTLYAVYRDFEDRSQELCQSAETAFLTAGRFVLADGDVEKALSYFDIGIQVAARRFDYVERVVLELVGQKVVNAAATFLSKISPEDQASVAFEQLAFCVDQLTMTGEQIMNRGRQIIFQGKGTPEIFHAVIRSFAEAGKETLAESAIGKAIETNPELRDSLYKVLAENLPKPLSKQAA
jgi:tetratricopeptide (TPR) repeat protein